ncbi:HEPN domain-containing protein [Chromohalobacter israelensis]
MDSPVLHLKNSMKDARRLMQIHKDVGGTGQGRRYGLDVLNKSGVMFVAAAWEAFVEEAATQAIDHILDEAESHNQVPLPIRKAAAKGLETHKNDLKVWDLAGDGWKQVVRSYRDQVIKDEIATFNTPKPHNVDTLYKKLLGIDSVSSNWNWRGMSSENSKRKLKRFMETRGAIAHRGDLDFSITKSYVEEHRKFINRLAIRTSNVIRDKVYESVESYPWRGARYGSFQ